MQSGDAHLLLQTYGHVASCLCHTKSSLLRVAISRARQPRCRSTAAAGVLHIIRLALVFGFWSSQQQSAVWINQHTSPLLRSKQHISLPAESMMALLFIFISLLSRLSGIVGCLFESTFSERGSGLGMNHVPDRVTHSVFTFQRDPFS